MVTDSQNTIDKATGNRKRIAKNTIFLAIRQLVVMAIALFTSRIILEALGVVDYGVYNVVAGVTASFVFFSIALSMSTQRFLNFEMGRNNEDGVRRYFSLSLWSYIGLAFLVVLIGSFFGPWLVYDVLIIPETSQTAALWVYYSMLGCLAVTLIFSVYESMLIAHENMKIYAWISILEAAMKLIIAYAVMVVPNKLITYGLLMVAAMLLPKFVMVLYCYKKYPESHAERFWDRSMFKELMGFAGWNAYSGIVYIVNDQGLNVALNIYFGPVVNAARGVAQQVLTSVQNFNVSFFTAVRPQLVKSYAAKAYNETRNLLSFSTRISYYLIWVISLPIMLRADQILGIWLTEVPGFAVVFVQWSVAYGLAGAFFNPSQALAQATGHLKRYSLFSINTYLLAFPIAVALISCGAPAWSVYPVLSVMRFASAFVGIRVLRPYIMISWGWMVRKMLWPIVPVTVLSFAASYLLEKVFGVTIWGLLGFTFSSVISTGIFVLLFGLNGSERNDVLEKIKRMIRKSKRI